MSEVGVDEKEEEPGVVGAGDEAETGVERGEKEAVRGPIQKKKRNNVFRKGH